MIPNKSSAAALLVVFASAVLVGAAYAATSTVQATTVNSTLTVTKAGSGAGTITSNVGVINCGAICSDTYANGTSITLTATPAGGSQFTGWLGPCTGVGTCQFTINSATTVLATFASPVIAASKLDIDGATGCDALTDGLLVLRYLFGLSGASLINGAVGPGATRTTATQIGNYLADIRPVLDIDGNGEADALTDGLLVIRYLFGLRGASLIAGAVGPGAIRTIAGDIEAQVQGLCADFTLAIGSFLANGQSLATIPFNGTAKLTASYTGGIGTFSDGVSAPVSILGDGTPVTLGGIRRNTTYTLTVVNGAGGSAIATLTVVIPPFTASGPAGFSVRRIGSAPGGGPTLAVSNAGRLYSTPDGSSWTELAVTPTTPANHGPVTVRDVLWLDGSTALVAGSAFNFDGTVVPELRLLTVPNAFSDVTTVGLAGSTVNALARSSDGRIYAATDNDAGDAVFRASIDGVILGWGPLLAGASTPVGPFDFIAATPTHVFVADPQPLNGNSRIFDHTLPVGVTPAAWTPIDPSPPFGFVPTGLLADSNSSFWASLSIPGSNPNGANAGVYYFDTQGCDGPCGWVQVQSGGQATALGYDLLTDTLYAGFLGTDPGTRGIGGEVYTFTPTPTDGIAPIVSFDRLQPTVALPYVSAFSLSKGTPSRLFTGTSSGVFVSADTTDLNYLPANGGAFTVNNNLAAHWISAFARVGTTKAMYAAAESVGTIFRSDDGVNWTVTGAGVGSGTQGLSTLGPISTLVAAPPAGHLLARMANDSNSFWESFDDGHHWEPVSLGVPNHGSIAVDAVTGDAWAAAFNPTGDRIFKMPAAGGPFKAVTATGLQGTPFGIAARNGVVYVFSTPNALSVSTDGGATFGAPVSIPISASRIVVTAAAAYAHALNGNVIRSIDQGASWVPLSTTGLPGSPFMWGVVAAAAGAGEKLYASLFRTGLYEYDFLNATWLGPRNPLVGSTPVTQVQSIIGGAAGDATTTFWVGTGNAQPSSSFVTATGGK